MQVIPAETTASNVLQLFSEHDDYMIDFLGEDKRYYTRYSEKENLERVWVAYVEDLPVGCVAYRTKGNGVAEVKRLFVRNACRGMGLSKDLLKTVENYAKEQGCHRLILNTRITLEPAVSLYRALGFHIVFQQGLYIQMEKEIG